MAEGHRRGVATMLAADAQLDARTGLAAPFCGRFDQFANAFLVQRDEGVLLVDALVLVDLEETAGIIAGNAQRCLRQVVVPKEKNAADWAMSPARRAARGSSIMVPTI